MLSADAALVISTRSPLFLPISFSHSVLGPPKPDRSADLCALPQSSLLGSNGGFWRENRHISQVYSNPSGVINMVVPEEEW